MFTVTVNHTFEAGHRLPHIEGKCQSLHGHSWRVEVEVTRAEPIAEDVLVEFGHLKAVLRAWIDSRFDHGLILGHGDPLVDLLVPHGKVYVVGVDEHSDDFHWPTVENVAAIIGGMIVRELPDIRLVRVTVHETPTNRASWREDMR